MAYKVEQSIPELALLMLDIIAGAPKFGETPESLLAANAAKRAEVEAELGKAKADLKKVPARFKAAAEAEIAEIEASMPPELSDVDAAKAIEVLRKKQLETYALASIKRFGLEEIMLKKRGGGGGNRSPYRFERGRLHGPQGEVLGWYQTTADPKKAAIFDWALPDGHENRDKGGLSVGYIVGEGENAHFQLRGRIKVTEISEWRAVGNMVKAVNDIFGISTQGINNTPFQQGVANRGGFLSKDEIAKLIG